MLNVGELLTSYLFNFSIRKRKMADEADPLRGNPGLQTSEAASDYELQR
jgi:hypothetical protein